jgi:hypothetical protein
LSGGVRAAAALVAAPAAIVLAAYAIDRVGGSFPPSLVWPIPLLAIAGAWLACRSPLLDRAELWRARGTPMAFAIVITATFGWLLWLARPTYFPLGSGPDLTHHLLLIGYIERHWRLVHDPGVEQFLGEMANYTPGSHILAALAGAWSRSTGLHVLQAVLAATTALKAGFVFLIARRVLPPRAPLAAALTAPAALLLAPRFFVGAFIEFEFYAQVVAELFALAFIWTIVVWHESPSWTTAAFAGAIGGALFLTWPVLIGPPLVVLGVMCLVPNTATMSRRSAQATLTASMTASVALVFIAGRAAWLGLAATGGDTAQPSISAYGWIFLLASTAGLALACFRRRARVVAVCAGAVLLQMSALGWVAARSGNAPYLALKLLYLFVCVQAVGAAIAAADLSSVLDGMAGVYVRLTRLRAIASQTIAVALLVAVLAAGLLSIAPLPDSLYTRHRATTSAPLEEAGLWAAQHVPPECVEYLVGDDETAYWLHLSVLGNPRMSPRTADTKTFEPVDAVLRWLTPGGLPYAIVDLPSIPRDVREELDILTQFGTAAVAKRRGPSSCAGAP